MLLIILIPTNIVSMRFLSTSVFVFAFSRNAGFRVRRRKRRLLFYIFFVPYLILYFDALQNLVFVFELWEFIDLIIFIFLKTHIDVLIVGFKMLIVLLMHLGCGRWQYYLAFACLSLFLIMLVMIVILNIVLGLSPFHVLDGIRSDWLGYLSGFDLFHGDELSLRSHPKQNLLTIYWKLYLFYLYLNNSY